MMHSENTTHTSVDELPTQERLPMVILIAPTSCEYGVEAWRRYHEVEMPESERAA